MKERIGQYQIIRILGRGGMGAVYLAKDTLLDREVAIKTVQSHMDTSTDRFFQEARTLAKLNHLNIASLYNLIQEEEQTYMVMEYVKGIDLDDLIKAKGKLGIHQTKQIFTQVLHGLNHAHESGTIHRDIKSSNVMINERGVAKLMDFGIAVSSGNERYTKTGNILGTLEYISPEIIKGEQPSVQSDIYAMGILLYEMVSGRTPFQGTNEYALINAHVSQKPPELGNEAPASIKRIINKCLAKTTDKRYQSVQEILFDLRHVEEDEAKTPVLDTASGLIKKTNDLNLISRIKPHRDKLIMAFAGIIIIICMALLIPKNMKSEPQENEPVQTETNVPTPSPKTQNEVSIVKKDPIELKINQYIYEGRGFAKSKTYVTGTRNLWEVCNDILELDPGNQQVSIWISEMINFFMSEGLQLLKKDQLKEARNQFESVLLIDNNHQGAKNQLFKIDQRMKERSKKSKSNSNTKKTVKALNEKSEKATERNPIKPIQEERIPVVKEDTRKVEQTPAPAKDEEPKIEKEEVERPKAKKRNLVSVRIPKNQDIVVAVTSTLSSMQSLSKGKSIPLSVMKNVYVDGILVIEKGANARGVLENFKTSNNNQKGLIELKVKQVQAVDGSWIEVKRGNFKIPGDKGKEIKFTSSTQLQVKTSKSINIKTYQ